MKLAIVFDDLIQYGGAERLLLAVTEVFSNAPVFTSVATSEWEEICKEKHIKLRTSFMQKLPFKKGLNRLYSVLGLHILAFESLDFSQFDVVLSISARYAHGIITKPDTKHICYMNSPGRMFWDSFSYFQNEGIFIKILRPLIQPFLAHARNWDFTASQRVDFFIANSPVPQKRIEKYYKRDSEVIFPPVEFPNFQEIDSTLQSQKYFLIVTRLLSWKKVDIAIKACAKLKRPLKIIGTGPALKDLQKLAKTGSLIEFLGYVSEEEKWKLLKNCEAFIMTQEEDFGISPLEAMAMGKPVIAYKKGGALVYVTPQETGEFFEEQTPESLAEVLQSFEATKFHPHECQTQANLFTKQKFQEKIADIVNKVYYKAI